MLKSSLSGVSRVAYICFMNQLYFRAFYKVGWQLSLLGLSCEHISLRGYRLIVFYFQINYSNLMLDYFVWSRGCGVIPRWPCELTQCQTLQIDKSIGAMYRRLQKTLTSDELFPSLWDKCKVSHFEHPIIMDVQFSIAPHFASDEHLSWLCNLLNTCRRNFWTNTRALFRW